jgi:hypothetical protein
VGWLEELAKVLPPGHVEAGLTYPVRALESDSLLDEITEAAGRISALLASAKQYTQMDRAPLQTFDVHEGLDATLTMLGHKLGEHRVDRTTTALRRFLPSGRAESGVDQLIDNAAGAMEWRGKLTVRTRQSATIASWSRSATPGRACPTRSGRIFEPFFTRRTSGGHRPRPRHRMAIVVGRHGGEIRESEPGNTRFQVIFH